MKPNIAFDIDGIVANFSQGFLVWVEEEYGLTFTSGNQFNWSSDQGIPDKTFKRIIAEFIRDHSYLINPLKDGANLVRYVWEKTSRPITFITARDGSTIQATHSWLNFHFPAIDFTCVTVKRGSSKYRYLDEFDCFIDDRRKTAVDLAGIGKVVFLPSRQYNVIRQSERVLPINYASLWDDEINSHSVVLIGECDDMTDGVVDELIFKE